MFFTEIGSQTRSDETVKLLRLEDRLAGFMLCGYEIKESSNAFTYLSVRMNQVSSHSVVEVLICTVLLGGQSLSDHLIVHLDAFYDDQVFGISQRFTNYWQNISLTFLGAKTHTE